MTLNQLRYFKMTADTGNLRQAAEKLFISQPSLTLSIQNLEKELGVELFERSRGALSLTFAGQLFYDWALNTLHSREQLDARIGDIKEEGSHLIRLGISPHRSSILLPRILPRFYELFPYSEIFLEEKPTYQLRTMLEEEQLDLIIDVPHPDSLNYQNIVLAQEHLVLAVPEVYIKELPEITPEAQVVTMDPSKVTEEIVPMQYFGELPFFMLAEPQNLTALSRRIYESAGFLPQTRLVCRNIVTALGLVKSGLGIVIAPEIYSHPEYAQEGIRYFRIDPLMAGQIDVRQICLVYRKSLYLHAGLKTLIDLFVELAPEVYRGA